MQSRRAVLGEGIGNQLRCRRCDRDSDGVSIWDGVIGQPLAMEGVFSFFTAHYAALKTGGEDQTPRASSRAGRGTSIRYLGDGAKGKRAWRVPMFMRVSGLHVSWRGGWRSIQLSYDPQPIPG